MIQLAFEAAVFLAVSFALTWASSQHRMNQPSFGDAMLGSEVFYVARKCQNVFAAKTLVVGDSVANQFFDYRLSGETIESLTCNAGITLIGQSILVEEATKTNPGVSKVFLILHPSSLQIDLLSKYAFHYFLKPFYRERFLSHFSETALHEVDQIPFNELVWLPQVRTSNWSPRVSEPSYGPETPMISSVNADYLNRLVQRMNQRKIKFVLLCPPLHPSFKPYIERLKINSNEYSLSPELMAGYFDSVEYIEGTEFCDEVHLYLPGKFRDRFHRWIDVPYASSDWEIENKCCQPLNP